MRGTGCTRDCVDVLLERQEQGSVLLWAGLGHCLHHYLLNMGWGDFGSEAMSARFDTELAYFLWLKLMGDCISW